MLARGRHEDEGDDHAGALEPFPDLLRDGPDPLAVEARVRDEDAQVVVGRPVAEVGQGVERDVAVETADVEGRRGTDLVGEPGGLELVDGAVDGLDLDRAFHGDVGKGQAGALEEHLAARRRPRRAGLGRDEVQALVLEVPDGGQLELAVAFGPGPQADRDAAAGLGVGDPRHPPHGLHEVVAEPGRGKGRAGRPAGQVDLAEALLEERARAGDRAHGEDADGDREDDQHGPGAGDAEVAEDLAPADAMHGRAARQPPRPRRAPRRTLRAPGPGPRRAPRRRGASRRGASRRPCGPSGGRGRRSPGRGSP